MGTKERRERERLEMKDLILDTATRQLEELGYDKMTIRSIAEEIEYSPRTIYLYFKDKDELLYAISIKAFTLFAKAFESVLEIEDPYERLMGLNRAYFKFAFDNPGYYDLMFILRGPMNSDLNQDSWDIGMRSHQILEETVRDCMKAGYFNEQDPDVVAFTLWSYVHGVVSLKIRDRLRMYPEDIREDLISQSIEIIHTMMKKK